jgi:hypothetical protein
MQRSSFTHLVALQGDDEADARGRPLGCALLTGDLGHCVARGHRGQLSHQAGRIRGVLDAAIRAHNNAARTYARTQRCMNEHANLEAEQTGNRQPAQNRTLW